MSTTNKTWLGNLIAKVAAWFSTASNDLHDFTVIADNLVNAIKKIEASTVGQFLETTVEILIPASTGLVNAFKLWLPVVVIDLNWALQEEGKTNEQKITDAAAYLIKLKVINPDAYATQANALNALIQKWLGDNSGIGTTIQQALVSAPIVHDPSLLNINQPLVLTPDPYTIPSPQETPIPPAIG